MNKEQIEVYDIVKLVGVKHAYKHLKYKHPEYFDKIEEQEGSRFTEQLYRYCYSLTGPHLCVECKINPTSFKSFRQGYRHFCNKQCAASNRANKLKKKDTCKQTYGTETASQSKEVDEKRRQTLIERYGTDSLIEIRHRREKNKNETGS